MQNTPMQKNSAIIYMRFFFFKYNWKTDTETISKMLEENGFYREKEFSVMFFGS